ncbi:MAG: type II toxin-antitoxin system VapC family toxin [Deltaproteobacteria bacterium]|nr:type II toxin-antitoxin system VapC family toxin [Deltaproteobacteria bacterium]
MYLFDTNIFLEILLDQKQADACQKALTVARKDSPIWITHFSLHAIEAIIGGRKRFEILQKFLSALEEHPHLFCYATTVEEELEVTRLGPKNHLDFDDALQYYVALKKKLTLVTLDSDFKNLKQISVLSPQDLLS